jgi:hypothetical protein
MVRQLAVTFVQIVLPVVLVGGLGYLMGRLRPIDLGAVTAFTVTALVPGVVFDSLARAAVPRAVLGRLALHVGLQLVAVAALAGLAARICGWRGPTRAGLLLATLFPNAGNIGLPLALFAFGRSGLTLAAGWFALTAVATHTVGLYIAARARSDPRAAVARLARLPILYAMAAGIAVNLAGITLPTPVARASELLAQGSIAVMLLLLGLQLAELRPRAEAAGALVATLVRLVLAPPVAWLAAWLVGLEGSALAIAVVQASTPTAVTAALWAMEFDARPGLVAAAVVTSTLGAIATLTVLVALLAR